MAQWIAHLSTEQEVLGSTPSRVIFCNSTGRLLFVFLACATKGGSRCFDPSPVFLLNLIFCLVISFQLNKSYCFLFFLRVLQEAPKKKVT